MCPENIKFSCKLAEAAHHYYPDITVYCWTGYTLEELKKENLKYIDVLIDGRFDLSNRDITLKFRGSPNQRILYKNKGDF